MASSNAVNRSSVSVSSVFSELSTTDVNPADAMTEDYFPSTSIPVSHLNSIREGIYLSIQIRQKLDDVRRQIINRRNDTLGIRIAKVPRSGGVTGRGLELGFEPVDGDDQGDGLRE
jgi:hypothetical protein